MSARCHSRNRCAQITCETCARRYAAHVARRILDAQPTKLFAIEIEPFDPPADFRTWRIEVRNLIDHQRRQNRWWRQFGLHVWRSRDGRIHGIAFFSSVTPEEVATVIGSRWPVRLRAIGPHELRQEIAAVVRPGVIAAVGRARYQGCKLAIWPRRSRTTIVRQSHPIHCRTAEPMPVII